MTSDGYIKVMKENAAEGDYIFSQKRHRLPVTCLAFKNDSSGSAEYILSGSPDYTYNIIPCTTSWISKILIFLNLSLEIIFGFLFKLFLIAALAIILLPLAFH